MMIPYNDPRKLISDLMFWYQSIRDAWPDFESRMIRKETKYRRQHDDGEISDSRLRIELDAIAARRKAKEKKRTAKR